MTTLKEQRMIHTHQWGRRTFRDGAPLIVPVFLKDPDERDAFIAGYLGEQRRVRVAEVQP